MVRVGEVQDGAVGVGHVEPEAFDEVVVLANFGVSQDGDVCLEVVGNGEEVVLTIGDKSIPQPIGGGVDVDRGTVDLLTGRCW